MSISAWRRLSDVNAAVAVKRCDIAIVGGGMVGLSLAAALRELPLDVVVIEPVPAGNDLQPSFDERTTALSSGSRRILEGIGVWRQVAAEATPIKRIHVSDRGRFAMARLSAEEQRVSALGYTLTNRVLGMALADACQSAPRLAVLCPASVTAVTPAVEGVTLEITGGWKGAVHARLVVAADGARSIVRAAFGVDATVWDYGQHAVIANLVPGKFHDFVAYERFTEEGPMAVLPLADGRCTVVWTLAPGAAEAALALDEHAFLAALQDKFGYRLGRFTRVGRRTAYPLSLTRSERQVAPRAVIIGNAAQGLHPIAGQGFNLGLRDVAALAEVVADDLAARGSAADPGAAAVLDRYAAWRRADRRTVIAFTDALVRIFGSPLPPVRAARDASLLLFDLATPAKQAFARVTMGLAGELPRLARGVPLA
jgi:2-octaprenyl-6-methoxyphenol hydroxylase